MPRTIGSLGSVALLVSSITGPSMVVIPLLFQQAGWLTPILTFIAIALLSGTAALFIIEAMSSIEGNELFQASIEFTTIAHLFLGKRWHIVIQGLLFLAIQTLVIASLLESFQSMDAFLINLAHKTCAVSFTDGWVCVDHIPPNASSAFTGHILGSFGTLMAMSLILPLSLVHLVDNIIFQVASFIVLLIITVVWIVIFIVRGLNTNPIPVVGHDQSTVVGFVLSNFAFVTTIPAWVNNVHPSVNIRLVVWASILISCLLYIPIGWMGGLAFVLSSNATLLQALATDTGHGVLSVIARVSSYVFPLAVLITSIPVFTIVVRYNLLRGNIFSYKMAVFWSAIFPWLIAIPFQTNGGLATILNWASLVFTSPSNLLVPFILFIVSKRHSASAVLDSHVLPGTLQVSEVAALPTPVELTTAPERAATPVENIPVVIITDSMDGEPGSAHELKTLMSKTSRNVDKSALEVIPMPVMNRVSSPSRHRYYGQEVLNEGGDISTSTGGVDHPFLFLDTTDRGAADAPTKRRPSLSLSLSPHSIMHSSNTGMDEFLLLSPTSPESPSHSVRAVVSAHSPRSSVSTGLGSVNATIPGTPSARDDRHLTTGLDQPSDTDVLLPVPTSTVCAEEPVPTFKAFPGLSPVSPIRPTRISAIGCVVSTVLVLTAIVYTIVETAKGAAGG